MYSVLELVLSLELLNFIKSVRRPPLDVPSFCALLRRKKLSIKLTSASEVLMFEELCVLESVKRGMFGNVSKNIGLRHTAA